MPSADFDPDAVCQICKRERNGGPRAAAEARMDEASLLLCDGSSGLPAQVTWHTPSGDTMLYMTCMIPPTSISLYRTPAAHPVYRSAASQFSMIFAMDSVRF
jgi:hypothetical protein